MEYVAFELKLVSGKIISLLTTFEDTSQFFTCLQTSSEVESFIAKSSVGKKLAVKKEDFSKWVETFEKKEDYTDKLYIAVVKYLNFPNGVELGDSWKKNGDDLCFSSSTEAEIDTELTRIGLSKDKCLIKIYGLDHKNNKIESLTLPSKKYVLIVNKNILDKYIPVTNEYRWIYFNTEIDGIWVRSPTTDSVITFDLLISDLKLHNVPYKVITIDD